MKSLLLTCAFVAFGIGTLFSQENEWTLLVQKDSVNISFQYADCIIPDQFNQQRALFKFENTSSKTVQIQFDIHVWDSFGCRTCNDPNGEFKRTITLKKYCIEKGQCIKNEDQAQYLFIKFDDKRYVSTNPQREITNFEIQNVVINEVNFQSMK